MNNTVADNVSTATSRQSFPSGQKVQSTRQVAGIARVSGASNTLLNNIVSGNHAFTWSISAPVPPSVADRLWPIRACGTRALWVLPGRLCLQPPVWARVPR